MKYWLMEKKYIIILGIILLICAIAIAVGVYFQITNKKLINIEKPENYEQQYIELKNSFTAIFDNKVYVSKIPDSMFGKEVSSIIYNAYDIEENKSGKYSININIPHIKIEKVNAQNINKEIKNTFGMKAISIYQDAKVYTIYNVNYVGYINDNIISIVIFCKFKDGNNAQRIIIKTYNYDIENDKVLTLKEILDRNQKNRDNLQDLINNEIKKSSEEKETIIDEGYNIYQRNLDDDMYKIENTEDFFINAEGFLYVIYPYGNTNYTSEYDLVIMK